MQYQVGDVVMVRMSRAGMSRMGIVIDTDDAHNQYLVRFLKGDKLDSHAVIVDTNDFTVVSFSEYIEPLIQRLESVKASRKKLKESAERFGIPVNKWRKVSEEHPF